MQGICGGYAHELLQPSCYLDPLNGIYFEGPLSKCLEMYSPATSFQSPSPDLLHKIRIEEHLPFLWVGFW